MTAPLSRVELGDLSTEADDGGGEERFCVVERH